MREVNVRNNRRVEVIRPQPRPLLMDEPKRHRHHQPNHIRPRHPLINLPTRKQLMRQPAPGDRLRVILLRLLAAPYVGAFDAEEDVALVVDDGVHEDEVEDGAEEGADGLCEEGGSWGEFGVLGDFEVAEEELGLVDGVVAG